ncbi:nuclear transport factor 2 family protein [Constantimarinum furrinae]|uniref:3-methyl-2-oxobutanoate hydroxymethyltransferase n=1 Tax=Constantimarinum furrinae TaxID=2562285 RepID=A0A7G8PXE6_9FLAO|nr:nuclear transport factor 2 family protein [Constantimarinum furrinae]QNJ99012.1 hypothetical protein ALE3EI_2476 [Constantimarinum furrinae]
MKFIPVLFAVFFTISAMSQDSFTEKNAQQVVDTFFDGFHKGDSLIMKSVMADKLIMQTAFTDGEGVERVTTSEASNLLNAIANRPADQQWEERLLGYTVQIDGNLAHVWTPYQFWFNDTFSHCGANAFTLAKTSEGWKIIHLIDSRRKAGCNE